jgi:hypothetical protein
MSLELGVEKPELDGGEDPVTVGPDGLRQLHELRVP